MEDQNVSMGEQFTQALGAQPVSENSGMGSGMEGSSSPAGNETSPAGNDSSLDQPSMQEFANQVADQMLNATPAPRTWEDDSMGKLTAHGLPEGVARQLVNQGGRKNVEAILAGLGNSGNAEGVKPEGALEGGAAGAGLAGALAGANKGSETADTQVGSELAQVKQVLHKMQTDALVPRLTAAREELTAMYPELQDQAAWNALVPKVQGALSSGFAQDPVQALKGAVQFTYGARVQGQTASQPMTVTDPTPGRAGNPTPGERAADSRQAKKRIAQMVFEGRSSSEIEAVRKDYEQRLGIRLGSSDS